MNRLMAVIVLCAVVSIGLVGCGDKSSDQKVVNPAAPSNGQAPLSRKIPGASGGGAPSAPAQAKLAQPQ